MELNSLQNEIEHLKKELEISKETIRSLTDQLSQPIYGISSFSFNPHHGLVKIQGALSIVIVGASGELAKKKIIPTLFALYKASLLPSSTLIVGFARTMGDDQSFRQLLSSCVPILPELEQIWQDFLKNCFYIKTTSYSDTQAWQLVHQKLYEFEKAVGSGNRLFYLAIPPDICVEVCPTIKQVVMTKTGWNRVIVEKPFGRDYESAIVMTKNIAAHWSENSIFRIDHYLGKEMVQNLLVLRFSNTVFEPIWNRNFIANVTIIFKEHFGMDGRGAFFDEYGIIRDVMQNHLMQIFSLIAMEPPVSLGAEDIRNEKVKVLRSTQPVTLDHLIIGQYTYSEGRPAYVQEPGVKANSLTDTFAQAILKINNVRWQGVPFIVKCAKGVNERKAEIRIQFRQFPSAQLFEGSKRNELVIRVQPNECIYLRMMNKAPGLSTDLTVSDLDLLYKDKFPGVYKPEAYERLILDSILGDHNLFVRDDELVAAWKLFSPVLKQIKEQRIAPILYAFGSEGPLEAERAALAVGWIPSV